jgi:transposase-like protein
MEKEKPKVLHTELKGNLSTRFNIIKSALGIQNDAEVESALGIQNDAEVVRYLIQNYFNEYLEVQRIEAGEGLEEDRKIIKKFMKKYGEEWRKLGED